MAIYHFEAKIISRGAGRSAVAAAAYQSGERLYNDYDGITHDYRKKGGVLFSEILLPPQAPAEWFDRETLWNRQSKGREKSLGIKDTAEVWNDRISLPAVVGSKIYCFVTSL